MSGSPTGEVGGKPANPFATDVGLRPVRMASGKALTLLQTESASQVLCQALPVERWQQLMGGGKVGRRPLGAGADPGCQVGSSELNVTMSLRQPVQQRFTAPTQVAGRPVEIKSKSTTVATVALTDQYFTHRQGRVERPLLDVMVNGYMNSMSDAERRPVLDRLLDALVPVLAAPGDPVPAANESSGEVPFRRTPVTPEDFIDLPKPIQALQLCTATLDVNGAEDANQMEASEDAECVVRVPHTFMHVRLRPQPTAQPTYPATIGGRPGIEGPDHIRVLLRDKIPVELEVTGEGAEALTEKLVPELS